jgi:hypothetical protein
MKAWAGAAAQAYIGGRKPGLVIWRIDMLDTRRAALAALTIWCSLTAGLPGQAPAQPSNRSAPPPDTISVYLGFVVPSDFRIPKALIPDYLLDAQSIASVFEPPRPWVLPLWPGTHQGQPGGLPDPKDPWLTLGLEGFLVFRVTADGHLESSQFTGELGAPGLGAAFQDALRRADSLGTLLAPAAIPKERHDTTLVLQVASSLARPPEFIPFARVRLVSIRVDRAAKLLDLAKPDFGRGSPNLHLRGVVILEHVVGTDGHSDSSSAQVIYSDGPELTKAAVGAVLGGHFEPALAQGIPVPFRVVQRISFNSGVSILRIPFAVGVVRP